MNNQSGIKFPTQQQIISEANDRKERFVSFSKLSFFNGIKWMRSEILRLNPPEVKTKEGNETAGKMKKLAIIATHNEIIYKHLESGTVHKASIESYLDSGRVSGGLYVAIKKCMEEYANQPCQSQGGFTESDMEWFANRCLILSQGTSSRNKQIEIVKKEILELIKNKTMNHPTPANTNILNEFFNHKSDANKYLTAEEQEDLEKDFSEWIKTIEPK